MRNIPRFLGSALRLVFQNFFTKLLCLAMAFVLYIYVNTSQNIDRELEIPLFIANRPSDLLITSQSATEAKVVLNGPKAKMDQLKPNDLSVTLAFRPGQGPGEIGFQLYADQVLAPPGIRVRSIEPTSILLRLEPLVARSLPILADLQGEPKEGYEVVETRIDADSIEVAGPPSILDELTHIKTETIDISGLNSGFKQRVGFRTPNLVSLSERRSTIVALVIREKLLERTFENVPIHLVSNLGRLEPEVASVQLKGPYSLIQSLSAEALSLGVSEEGLVPGEKARRSVVIRDELPSKVEARIEPKEILVILAPPTPTPTLPPAPTLTPTIRPAQPRSRQTRTPAGAKPN